jgi:fumarylpyruvate hydrolase
MTAFVFPPPAPVSAPVAGLDARFPLRRVYCIGRNYAAHAIEMGHDPDREPPFFFQKNPDNLAFGGSFPYPAESADVHHEVELAVALGAGGSTIAEADALAHVWGYAVALDMTRRDLQGAAKAAGRPWEIGKAFEHSAPMGALHPVAAVGHPVKGAITLAVNGVIRQSGDLNQLIWTVPEIIAHLSRYFVLAAGDVILTGTPSGVGPVQRGDVLEASIAGLAPLTVTVV